MTRINAGIHPRLLTNEHLLAEHREIKRLCTLYYNRAIRAKQGLKISQPPKDFKLGQGHVLFFVDKPVFTLKRYRAIRRECLLRGLNVTNYTRSWEVYGNTHDLINSESEYVPAKAHINLVTKRIASRILYGKLDEYKYKNGLRLTRTEAISLLEGQP
jgi:deoxyribonuclease (pyrimidine dimer)